MGLTINIYYTGVNGSAKKFADEMISSGLVDRIKNEEGNIKYDYFFPKEDPETILLIDKWINQEALDIHHKSEMMSQIVCLREKYNLTMKLEQYMDKDDMSFNDVIKTRTAVRKFKDTKVSDQDINKILNAGRIAPTAKNNQPQLIYVAKSDESIELIDGVTPCRYNAPIVLIVCSDKTKAFTKENYSTYEMDASIVATHMMLEATNIGVDNIWVEMFDKDKLIELLHLKDNIEPICLLPIGYKTEDYIGNPFHNIRKELQETVKFI